MSEKTVQTGQKADFSGFTLSNILAAPFIRINALKTKLYHSRTNMKMVLGVPMFRMSTLRSKKNNYP